MNRWLLAVMPLALLAGCGPSVSNGVIVTGKLTKGGTPVAPDASGLGAAQVTLFSVTKAEDGSSTGGMAATDATGTFKIVGAGKGIPPGQYRIQLMGDAGPGEELFGGMFSGGNYLKDVEIPADKVGGEFDLGTIELDDAKPMAMPAAPDAP